MRTLSAELLAVQQSNHITPYPKAVVTDGVTTYTFDNVGYAGTLNRIVSITATEEPYGGNVKIRLRNNDKYFADKNLGGWAVTLGWGAKVGESYEVSNQSPLFVYNQHDISSEGVLLTELECLDYWWKLAYTIVVRSGELVVGEIDGTFEQGEVVTSSPNSYTAKLINVGYSNLLITSTSHSFSGETSLTGGTSSATMSITSVTSVTNAFGTDYARDDTVLTILKAITSGILTDVVIDSDAPDGQNKVNEYKPLLLTTIGSSGRAIIRQMLLKTPCVARIENDSKMHCLYPDPEGEVDYTYYTDHVFWHSVRDMAVVIPNTVGFVNSFDPDFWELYGYYSGSASNAASVALLGELGTLQQDNSIESEDEAIALAEAWITQRQTESYQGAVLAPMNCGQELYDQVTITDPRANLIITGRVGKIIRTYQSEENGECRYDIEVTLGGIASEPGSIGGPGTLEMDLQDMTSEVQGSIDVKPKLPPTPPWSTILPHAIQGYNHDIVFSVTDWNTVAWAAGTITFYDGTTQAVLAGNTGNLATTGIYVVYFDLADANPNVLKVVLRDTYYSTNMSEYTGTLCLCQRNLNGSTSAFKARMLPSYGKEPYITTDWIDMSGFKEWVDPETGTSYSAILKTDISAGHIFVSATTTTFAEGYDPSDKERAVAKQSSAPSSPSTGDLWLETDVTPNVLRRWSGSAWVKVSNSIYRQASQPSGNLTAGDIWIDTDDTDKPYTYNGSSWVASYTAIDGGHIITGTIDCSLVTISGGSSSVGTVVINTQGIEITSIGSNYDDAMTFSYKTTAGSGASVIGHIYATSSWCGIVSESGKGIILKQVGYTEKIQLEAEGGINLLAVYTTNIYSSTLNIGYNTGTAQTAYIQITSGSLAIKNCTMVFNSSTIVLPSGYISTAGSICYSGGHLYFWNGSALKQLAEV
jgi:hypothetical protein